MPWAACSGRCGVRPRRATSASVDRVGRRGRCTMATTSLPHRSLGRPATTQSYTAGWALTAASTSSANIFSPPELIVDRVAPVQLDRAVGAERGPDRRAPRSGRRRPPGRSAPSWPGRRGSRAPGARSWPASRARRRPGSSTRSRSADSTWLPGRPGERARRRARCRPRPATSCPPASDDPSPSTIISVGRWASSSSFSGRRQRRAAATAARSATDRS